MSRYISNLSWLLMHRIDFCQLYGGHFLRKQSDVFSQFGLCPLIVVQTQSLVYCGARATLRSLPGLYFKKKFFKTMNHRTWFIMKYTYIAEGGLEPLILLFLPPRSAVLNLCVKTPLANLCL